MSSNASLGGPAGFRILISGETLVRQGAGIFAHSCGGEVIVPEGKQPACPNCGQLLFPVLKLDCLDPSVSALNLWRLPLLQVVVCPACALYMEPYWIDFRSGALEIKGGERDDGAPLQEIEVPYEERLVRLLPLGHDDGQALGVHHQLGGRPFKRSEQEMLCCECHQRMIFAGVVDNDDLNVPLYEPIRRPVSLIIGDGDCLNWYTCSTCQVIGVCWAREPVVVAD